MSPELVTLLKAVNCRPAPPIRALPSSPSERAKLGDMVACCSKLVGYIQTHGITARAFLHGRTLAKLTDAGLSPGLAASFAPLSRLEQVVAENPRWSFVDLAAHVASVARNAVKGADI